MSGWVSQWHVEADTGVVLGVCLCSVACSRAQWVLFSKASRGHCIQSIHPSINLSGLLGAQLCAWLGWGPREVKKTLLIHSETGVELITVTSTTMNGAL